MRKEPLSSQDMSPQNKPTMWKNTSSPSRYSLADQSQYQSVAFMSSSQIPIPPILSPGISSAKPQINLHINDASLRYRSCHDCSSSSTCSHQQSSSDMFDNLPASSTPDLAHTTDNSSCATSPDIPLAQAIFTTRLHALLQAVQHQQSEEESGFSQDAPDDKAECITEAQGGEESESTSKTSPDSIKDHSNESSDESSSDISASSLGVWAPSPCDIRNTLHEGCHETALTHHNKRKHDDELSTHGQLNKYSSSVSTNKKAKHSNLGTRESASCRKLKSLASSSSISVSSTSECFDSSCCLLHPIIHPPAEPLRVATSPRDVAVVRIHALVKRERLHRIKDGLPAGPFTPADLTLDASQYLEADFRREVLQWILDVLPSRSFKPRDLYRHLKSNEETRFHAMYLFNRFVLLVGECWREADKETILMRRVRRELIWDVAFCCLVLSIKFHHDFLHPLYPIYSNDFLVISPQKLSLSEFERTQRDILEVVDYEIYGVSPYALFEELWAALPSLQSILDYRRPRQIVCQEMWAKLQQVSLDKDIMRFPVSFLTAAALVEGIVLALVDEYQQDDTSVTSTSNSSNSSTSSDCVNLEKAYREVNPICSDVAKVLGMSIADLWECRRWICSTFGG